MIFCRAAGRNQVLGLECTSESWLGFHMSSLHGRIKSAWAALLRQYAVFWCALSLSLLLSLYRVCIQSVVSYGCALWAVYRSQLPASVSAIIQSRRAALPCLRWGLLLLPRRNKPACMNASSKSIFLHLFTNCLMLQRRFFNVCINFDVILSPYKPPWKCDYSLISIVCLAI